MIWHITKLMLELYNAIKYVHNMLHTTTMYDYQKNLTLNDLQSLNKINQKPKSQPKRRKKGGFMKYKYKVEYN